MMILVSVAKVRGASARGFHEFLPCLFVCKSTILLWPSMMLVDGRSGVDACSDEEQRSVSCLALLVLVRSFVVIY